jgi:hypothetical protein
MSELKFEGAIKSNGCLVFCCECRRVIYATRLTETQCRNDVCMKVWTTAELVTAINAAIHKEPE